jgi:hypothetical protein
MAHHQRNRHADAQLEYRRVRTLRHQQQHNHAGNQPVGRVGLEWSISRISATPASAPPATQLSGIAADPADASLSQLTQAMVSYAPASGAPATSSALGQGPVLSSATNLLAATNHPQPIS